MRILTAYYWIFGGQIRRFSRDYFAQLCQTPEGAAALGHPPGWRDSYRQFREFGETVVDKFGAWKNDLARHNLVWANSHLLDEHHRRGEGYILMSAHLGNVEALRAVGETQGAARVNVFMLVNNARKVNRLLREVNQSVSLRMIVAEHLGPETAITLRERLAAGEVVALMGDRMTPSTQGRVFRIPFLGRIASIPHGPFILASLLDRPVYVIFVTRLGFRHYQVHLEPLAETLAFPRAQRMAQLEQAARRYVTMMEAQCRRTPHQWFNFYDFWQ